MDDGSKEKIIIEITKLDFVKTERHPLGAEQTMLSLLQEKGAPIKGAIYYELAPGYNVTRYSDKQKMSEIFIFERVKDEPKLQEKSLLKRWLWF